MTLDDCRIEAVTLPLNQLSVEMQKPLKECKSRRQIDDVTRVVLPDGRRMRVSDRFWASFSSLHNLGRSTFTYFSHPEVFQRITEKTGNAVRLAFEAQADGGRLLSCTNPAKPLLRLDEARELVARFNGTATGYGQGVVTATFDCPFSSAFQIGGDDFRTQFHVQMPVDGYGLPSSFLALLRMVCTNGLVAMSSAFKTTFQLGKESNSLLPVLERAMVTFNNEEGFHAVRQRLESASTSWASLNEARRLRGCLATAAMNEGMSTLLRNTILHQYDEACGDPLGIYGLTSQDEVSSRRARAIPVKATVYDLVNFATEATTHHLHDPMARSRVYGWLGDAITQEYDLEGTVTQFPDYQDYFLARGQAINTDPATAN